MFAATHLTLRSAWDLSRALARVTKLGQKGMNQVKDTMNEVFLRAENTGLVPTMRETFDESFHDYPELKALERAYPLIREECEAALSLRERIPELAKLGGAYTTSRVHTMRWKALMLKAGTIVAENARICPRTAELLNEIPRAYTAFLSILEPGTYISPHWGYFKGFYRYHLGVVIPDNNRTRECWLRINKSANTAAGHSKDEIALGAKYYWRNGKGVLFDDTCLHDAYNGTDKVRVVLFLDVKRKLPWGLAAYRELCLSAASIEPTMRSMRDRAVVKPAPSRASAPS
jgi:aspartyl/asparaginyl beta-hydroxylase (cupin superfamily)